MTARTAARTARDAFNVAVGTRAGSKTAKAVLYQAVRELEAKARAWEAVSAALDANARDEFAAADVCAVGFQQQEVVA